MSYLTFHLLFVLPPVLVLALTQPRPLAGLTTPKRRRRARWGLPLICLIAFAYTTPWDNLLVYEGVWSYGPERVLATIGYVPVEEYAFFILQTLLTGLLLYQLLARLGRRPSRSVAAPNARPAPGRGARVVHGAGVALFLALTALGAGLLLSGWAPGRYAGLILAWAGPVLTGLWAYGGAVACARWRVFLPAVLAPTVYLWCADAIALRDGVWHIAEATSLGAGLLGLPVEEAAFFLVTNLMVSLGLLVWLFSEEAAAPGLFRRAPLPSR